MIRKEDLGTYWGSVLRENAWHHSLPLPRRRCPLPPEQWGECDETSTEFFVVMSIFLIWMRGITVYGVTKSNHLKEGG